MPKEDKTYMPAGMGGLMRFGEEEEPLVKIQPKHVVVVVSVIIVIEIIGRFLIR
ncbi:MAG: preprotein translocase subunit Sec61beta [Candidatus Aenigmarchaeota archaeon]|nr:preprotein translocase subunit Sec61beta [Candidatus Aenigmarchaeota archaeon]